ncbi:hypothetical protein [Nocardioides ferulae]|uniref:hypothetical protein n=1 Tax=Nocardioides ferulae TaxID=2340821 RepID=UPI000EB105D0|nr:hypothetical protein [Nocardioides ferulae]
MTETLKQLLHDQADDVRFDAVDVDTLVRAGQRRVRRRGLAVGAGALATAAVVSGVGLTQLGGDGGATGVDAADGLTTASVSYARGTVIHAGSDTLEVGHPVRAYVRTSIGYVVADPDGTVWSVTSAGTTRVGSTDPDPDRMRLVSDTDGTVAGWLDTDGHPVFLDQASGESGFPLGEESGEDGAGVQGVRELYAVDATTAYWSDAGGVIRAEISTGQVERFDGPPAVEGTDDGYVIDVEVGHVAQARNFGTEIVVPGGDPVRLLEGGGTQGDLSHDGRWLAQDADEAMVFDTSDGSRVPLAGDYAFAAAFEWLDDSRVVLIAQRSQAAPVQLLTCTVPAGTCEVSAELAPSFADFDGDIALPVGEPLED